MSQDLLFSVLPRVAPRERVVAKRIPPAQRLLDAEQETEEDELAKEIESRQLSEQMAQQAANAVRRVEYDRPERRRTRSRNRRAKPNRRMAKIEATYDTRAERHEFDDFV